MQNVDFMTLRSQMRVYDAFWRVAVLVGAGFDLGAVRTLVDVDFVLLDSNA